MTRILFLSVSLWLLTACSEQQGSPETNSVTESTEEQMGTVVESELSADVITQPQPIIEYIWHKLYRRFTGGGGYGGFVTTLLSGIDIALWDIKGKALEVPVYQLLGGLYQNKLKAYASDIYWQEDSSDMAKEALRIVAHILPFRVNNYVVENLIDWNNPCPANPYLLKVPTEAVPFYPE